MSTVNSAVNGLDMTIPGGTSFVSSDSYFGRNLTLAVQDQDFPKLAINNFDVKNSSYVNVQADHYKLVREISAASTVLLSNNGVFPLESSVKSIPFVGSDTAVDSKDLKIKTNKRSTFTQATVSISVKNSGSLDGTEVVQVYIGFLKNASEPPKLLCGFEKVFIKKGQKETIKFTLGSTELSIWNIESSSWTIPSGESTLHVDASSGDIQKSRSFTL